MNVMYGLEEETSDGLILNKLQNVGRGGCAEVSI